MASSSDGRMSPSLTLADKWERCEEVESEESDKESEATDAIVEKDVGIQQTRSGKGRGQASDLVYATRNPGSKKKTRTTPCFATRAEAVKAVGELKDKMEPEYEAIVLERLQADPLVRDLPRAPKDFSKAVAKRAYWVCSYMTGHYPKRMVVMKSGKKGVEWTPACVKCPVDNASRAVLCKEVDSTQPLCLSHGAVCRDHGNNPQTCMSCNLGKKRTWFCSTDCGTMLDNPRRISQGGTGLCPNCDPVDQAKRQKRELDKAAKTKQPASFTSREQFFAIANDEHFPDLYHESIGGVTCDETVGTGASKRRGDLATRLVDERCGTEFMHLDECDEAPHLKGKNCYSRDGVLGKLSGHMHDLGARAIPAEDATYIEENPLTPDEMSGKVQNAKTRNVARVLNKVLTQQQAQMIPIRVLSVGVDAYTDSTGKKHPSAFVKYNNDKGEIRICTNPKEWAHRVRCFVREKTKLLELGASGPSIVHVRLFYNGSDRESGLDK